MEKSAEGSVSKFVNRHISQLKVLSRLMEHELDAGTNGKEVTLDRELAENMLDTLEIFIEDFDSMGGGGSSKSTRGKRGSAEPKANVTRLN